MKPRKIGGCDGCPLRLIECGKCLTEIVYVVDGGRGVVPIGGALKAGQYAKSNGTYTAIVCGKCGHEIMIRAEP